jgi:hypothetical protein
MGMDQSAQGGQGSGRVVGRRGEYAEVGVDPKRAAVDQSHMRLARGEGVPDHAVERMVVIGNTPRSTP